jgi:hypothetical protein
VLAMWVPTWLTPASHSPRRRTKVFWLLFFKKVTA